MFNYDHNDDEDDGFIGTPFPALDADEIVSRKPEIDQTVRDEKGRRRFHGAFTGGFSAGYWNTVGSAEGFTPKIFISSRKEKFDKSGFTSKPEDFMDEEDFGSFGIAPKKIHTKDDFVENFTFPSLKDSKMTFDEVIRSVFQPSEESIGKRLFRKMKRNAKLEEKIPKESSPMENDDLVPNKTDEGISYHPKTNRHGLGYKGMLNPEVFTESTSKKSYDFNRAVTATLKSGRRLKISGEAFGYGALEEDDSMDIYSTEDLSQYDFEIGNVCAQTMKKNKKTFLQNQNNAIQLDGFTKSKENFSLFLDIKRKYRPPELPEGWKPKKIVKSFSGKKSRWDMDNQQSNDSKSKTDLSTGSKFKQQKVFNANLRAVILGESVVHRSGVAKDKPESNKELEFSKEINKSHKTTPSVSKTPLSGYFASKFTRSSTTINEEPLTAGLNKFENLALISSSQIGNKTECETNKDNDNITVVRTSYEWHPHKILCKRFGVQNPYPQFPDIVGVVCMNQNDRTRNMVSRLKANNHNQEQKSLFTNVFDGLNAFNEFIKPTPSTISNDRTKDEDESRQKSLKTFEPKLHVNEKQITDDTLVDLHDKEIEEKSRPPIDLFKSIFASDEEDEEEEEEVVENQKQTNESNKENSEKVSNTTINASIKKNSISKCDGIFSGIDFDQLKESFDPCLNSASSLTNAYDPRRNDNKQASGADNGDDDECYGPALPPTISKYGTVTTAGLMDKYLSKDYKTIKSKHKKSKKSKKGKKSKSKKSSSKHKISKKRKRSRSSSSLSSSSSDSYLSSKTDDNDDEFNDRCVEDKIFELIKKVKHS